MVKIKPIVSLDEYLRMNKTQKKKVRVSDKDYDNMPYPERALYAWDKRL